MAANKPQPINFSKFNIKNLSFSPLEKNERSKAQKIAYPRYSVGDGRPSNFVFQTPALSLNQYGIPSLGEFYKDDSARDFIKVPLDPNNKDAMALQKMFEAIDEMVGETHKKEILGKNHGKFAYSPLVKTPVEKLDDDDEDNEKKSNKKGAQEKFKYFKARISTDFETKRVTTLTYLKLKESKDGKKREKLENIETITDLASVIVYKSTIRMVIMANKLWAANAPDKSGKYGYGISLRIIQVEVDTAENGNSSIKNSFNTDAFIDEEDDAEESKTNVKKQFIDDDEEGEEDDDDDEGDEEEEEEEQEIVKAPPVVQNIKGKVVKK